MPVNYRRMAQKATNRADLCAALVATDDLTYIQLINAITYYRDAQVAQFFAMAALSGDPYCPCCGRVLG